MYFSLSSNSQLLAFRKWWTVWCQHRIWTSPRKSGIKWCCYFNSCSVSSLSITLFIVQHLTQNFMRFYILKYLDKKSFMPLWEATYRIKELVIIKLIIYVRNFQWFSHCYHNTNKLHWFLQLRSHLTYFTLNYGIYSTTQETVDTRLISIMLLVFGKKTSWNEVNKWQTLMVTTLCLCFFMCCDLWSY